MHIQRYSRLTYFLLSFGLILTISSASATPQDSILNRFKLDATAQLTEAF
jgi:hypothetical protein